MHRTASAGRARFRTWVPLAVLILAACASAPESDPEPGPLAQELAATAAATRDQIPPEALATIDAAQAELAASGIVEAAIGVGDAAPPFSLPAADGSTVVLDELLAQGPVVVTFYRGHW